MPSCCLAAHTICINSLISKVRYHHGEHEYVPDLDTRLHIRLPKVQQLLGSFHTKELEPFLIGCAVTILFCALAVGHGSLKKALTPYFRYNCLVTDSVNVLSMRIFKAVNKVIELLLRYFVMFLMMTMNGYVQHRGHIGEHLHRSGHCAGLHHFSEGRWNSFCRLQETMNSRATSNVIFGNKQRSQFIVHRLKSGGLLAGSINNISKV